MNKYKVFFTGRKQENHRPKDFDLTVQAPTLRRAIYVANIIAGKWGYRFLVTHGEKTQLIQ